MTCTELAKQSLSILKQPSLEADCLEGWIHFDRLQSCDFPGSYYALSQHLQAECPKVLESHALDFFIDHRALTALGTTLICYALGLCLIRVLRKLSLKAVFGRVALVGVFALAFILWDQVIFATEIRGRAVKSVALRLGAQLNSPELANLEKGVGVTLLKRQKDTSAVLVEVRKEGTFGLFQPSTRGFVNNDDVLWFRAP